MVGDRKADGVGRKSVRYLTRIQIYVDYLIKLDKCG